VGDGANPMTGYAPPPPVDSVHPGFDVPGLSAVQYLATQSRVIPTYLRLALWPRGQCADWTFQASVGPWEGPVIACSFLLLALVLLIGGRSRSPTGNRPSTATCCSGTS
jgi:hypothetical protein